MLRLLTHSTVLAFVLTVTACSSGSSSTVRKDSTPIVYYIDADVATVDAPSEVDAAIQDFDADSTPVPPPDATPTDLIFDPGDIFPCEGTPQQVNDCIINLQTRSGVPVTRPEPMDYSLCRP